jgi:hypothetical protein
MIVPYGRITMVIVHNNTSVSVWAHGRAAGSISDAGRAVGPSDMGIDKIVDPVPFYQMTSLMKKVFPFCKNTVNDG